MYETVGHDGTVVEHESLEAARAAAQLSGDQVRTRSVDEVVPAVYQVRLGDAVLDEFSSVPAAMAFVKAHPGSTIHLVAKS